MGTLTEDVELEVEVDLELEEVVVEEEVVVLEVEAEVDEEVVEEEVVLERPKMVLTRLPRGSSSRVEEEVAVLVKRLRESEVLVAVGVVRVVARVAVVESELSSPEVVSSPPRIPKPPPIAGAWLERPGPMPLAPSA